MQPLDLIETARDLTATQRGRPRQSDLRRAVSTVYYALFHALCRHCADTLIGTEGADRSEPAWRQAYRSPQHGQAKDRLSHKKMMAAFPSDVQNFGNLFVAAQSKRHAADYDPCYRVAKSEVLADATAAETVIEKLKDVPIKDLRALAAWVTLANRP